MREKSVTPDELMYIAAGYYHWTTGSFAFNATNPPLMKMITAAPLLLLGPDLPEFQGDPGTWDIQQQWHYTREFLYNNSTDADVILFTARLPVVLFGVILGLLVFAWSRRLYGDRAALLALFLYVFSPNILAHTRIAATDFGVTVFIFLSMYCFWRFVHRPTLLRLIACGLAFGAAMSTKTASIILVPVAAIYAVIVIADKREIGVWQRLFPSDSEGSEGVDASGLRMRQIVSFAVGFFGIGLGALLMVNAVYTFEGTFSSISTVVSPELVYAHLGLEDGFKRTAVEQLLAVPLPVPQPFTEVAFHQFKSVSLGMRVYFMGELRPGGAWYVMPVAFLIKTPIPFLALLLIAGFQAVRSRRMLDGEWLLILTPCTILALFVYLKSVSIGLRYVLPMYPFLHVWASGVLRDQVDLKRWAVIGLSVLAGWYAIGTLRIYPHYLAYFNEFIGGPRQGYHYLADSYLDWGQDLKLLKKYLDEKGIDRVRLAYFGGADPDYYGINYDYLPSVGPKPPPGQKWWYETRTEELPPFEVSGGPIAISASLLAGIFLPGYYSELWKLEPVDQVGYSILIYRPAQNP